MKTYEWNHLEIRMNNLERELQALKVYSADPYLINMKFAQLEEVYKLIKETRGQAALKGGSKVDYVV